MKKYVFNVEPTELVSLQKLYKDHVIESPGEAFLFVARKEDTTIYAYPSGKIVLEGPHLAEDVVFAHQYLNHDDYDAIGSDEVGTGDVFGPVVVCAAYLKQEDFKILEELNIRDSKTLTDRHMIKIAPILADRITHSILILDSPKYNDLTQKGYNMNKIKAYLHNHAIIKTSEKMEGSVPVIIDQFCEPHLYYNYLKTEKLIYRDVAFRTKGESVHRAVAAASIIARYVFLAKLHEYSSKAGMRLLKGASAEVDKQLLDLVDRHGVEFLPDITKMNFKNLLKTDILKKPGLF